MGEYISRELILIKVHASSAKRFEIIKIAELMGAKIVDVAQNTLTIEYCETTEQIKTLLDLLKPYGIREIARTGTVAIDKGSATATN